MINWIENQIDTKKKRKKKKEKEQGKKVCLNPVFGLEKQVYVLLYLLYSFVSQPACAWENATVIWLYTLRNQTTAPGFHELL